MYYSITQLAKTALALGTTIHDLFRKTLRIKGFFFVKNRLLYKYKDFMLSLAEKMTFRQF